MKKLVFLSVALATVMLLSCGGGSRHQAEREEDTVDVNDLIRDHTVYGLCGGLPSTNQLRVVTDNGDTLTLDITPAQNDHKMFGSVRVGDRLALMTNKKSQHALEEADAKDKGYVSYQARLWYNSEDKWYFPTSGVRFQAKFGYHTDNFVNLNGKVGLREYSAMLM